MSFTFFKMLYREIAKNKRQFIAAAAILFVGITIFAATYISYRNLADNLVDYYRDYKFMDYYAEAQSISSEMIKRIDNIQGVKKAIGRVSDDVWSNMNNDKKVTLRLISLPDNKSPEINDLFFYSGDWSSSDSQNACLVNYKFAQFYKLSIGDNIDAIINQKSYKLNIVGIVGSPEYVFEMKSAIEATSENFGILYVKQSMVDSVLGYDGSYSQVHVLFEQGADTNKIIDKIEDMLQPYGFTKGYERKDQQSNTQITQQIEEVQAVAVIFPAIFLAVAAMIIYLMLKKNVSNQRTSIAIMKALGYFDGKIKTYYMTYSLLIAAVGGVPGALTGMYASSSMMSMFTEIYSFPAMKTKIYWDALFIAVALCMLFCLMAGYFPAKKVVEIQPAQAMRSEVPVIGRKIIFERITFIWKRLTFGWKLSIRNLFRNPQRTFLTFMGTAFTVMFFIMTIFVIDSIDNLMNKSFYEFQKFDTKVTFSKAVLFDDAKELGKINGIKKLEATMEVPVRIRNGWIKKDTVLIGIPDNNYFYKFKDTNNNPVNVPKNGLIISNILAERMAAKVGDVITIEPYIGEIKKKDIVISGIIQEYIGFNCYMDMSTLGSFLQGGRYATSALLTIEPGMGPLVKKELNKIPEVDGVAEKTDSVKSFQQVLELMNAYIGFMVVCGIIMGFAIIFNITIMNVSERRRELASLKVLGYTSREIQNTVMRENLIISTLAIIPGLVFGRLLSIGIAKMFDTDEFVLDAVVYPKTYIIAILSVYVFTLLAQWANNKNIVDLDIVEVLKNREG